MQVPGANAVAAWTSKGFSKSITMALKEAENGEEEEEEFDTTRSCERKDRSQCGHTWTD
jgi:hypothetical protein